MIVIFLKNVPVLIGFHIVTSSFLRCFHSEFNEVFIDLSICFLHFQFLQIFF